MTILAGVYSRRGNQAPPDALCEALRSSLSRNPSDEVVVFKDPHCYLAKVNLGAYEDPGAHVATNGSVSMVTGAPIVRNSTTESPNRKGNLISLHEEWEAGVEDLLKLARGAFCAVHYQPQARKLMLVSDKLCVRPIYYFVDDDFVVFASALRILESLEAVPKQMDVRAVTEIVVLGFPLATRTPYANIRLMRAGEVIDFTYDRISSRQYWRWDSIATSQRSEEELLSETYEAFRSAVRSRLTRDGEALAFLSGGLDSRCVVAALRETGKKVLTFNFGLPGTQDQVFGSEFARAIKTLHHERSPETVAGWPSFALMLVNAIQSSVSEIRIGETALSVWSGDGGSVGLGHVYVGREVVELMRAGEVDAAVEAYLDQEKAHVPQRLFKLNVGKELSGIIARGIREELNEIRCEDPGRAFHTFLMLNDQRRHLASHYEDIDLHRVELLLPFYDSDLIATVMQVPLDRCLQHKFYTNWLKLFDAPVSSVPWQSYPGHEPCPLPVKDSVAYQWDLKSFGGWNRQRKRDRLRKAALVLNDHSFPESVIRRWYVRIATLMHQTGLRDYSYVIDAASVYHNYWRICRGKYVLDSEVTAAA